MFDLDGITVGWMDVLSLASVESNYFSLISYWSLYSILGLEKIWVNRETVVEINNDLAMFFLWETK